MRPIAPRIGQPEITIAEDQVEYLPITVARVPLDVTGYGLVLRFTFTAAEREAIAAGEDVYFAQIYHRDSPMTPVQARVGPGDWRAAVGPPQEET